MTPESDAGAGSWAPRVPGLPFAAAAHPAVSAPVCKTTAAKLRRKPCPQRQPNTNTSFARGD